MMLQDHGCHARLVRKLALPRSFRARFELRFLTHEFFRPNTSAIRNISRLKGTSLSLPRLPVCTLERVLYPSSCPLASPSRRGARRARRAYRCASFCSRDEHVALPPPPAYLHTHRCGGWHTCMYDARWRTRRENARGARGCFLSFPPARHIERRRAASTAIPMHFALISDTDRILMHNPH